MKQIGSLKKASSSWALTRSKTTGHFRLNYNGTGYYLRGKLAEVKADIDEAAAYIAANPTPPAEVEGSGHIYSWHDSSVPKEWKDADDAKRIRDHEIRTWEHRRDVADLETFDHLPVFEDVLVFGGYSKGQSSFTLYFYTSTGDCIHFGPKFVGQLIDLIIQQKDVGFVDVAGRYFGTKYDGNEHVPQEFTGKAVRLRFTFQKQGENIYAMPISSEDNKLWQPWS